jgi:hypothetical protein
MIYYCLCSVIGLHSGDFGVYFLYFAEDLGTLVPSGTSEVRPGPAGYLV